MARGVGVAGGAQARNHSRLISVFHIGSIAAEAAPTGEGREPTGKVGANLFAIAGQVVSGKTIAAEAAPTGEGREPIGKVGANSFAMIY